MICGHCMAPKDDGGRCMNRSCPASAVHVDPDAERRAFIRACAIRLMSVRENGSRVYRGLELWNVARDAWNSKPEDC